MPANDSYALLQTDVVDSTRMNATLGDHHMAAVWAAHDQIARDLIRRWQGIEYERTDGFLLAFHDPRGAVGFALGYHRALASLPVPLVARVGIHVGSVDFRTNGDADVADRRSSPRYRWIGHFGGGPDSCPSRAAAKRC